LIFKVLGNINSALAGKMDKLKLMRFLQKSYSSEIEKYFPLHFKQMQKMQKNQNSDNSTTLDNKSEATQSNETSTQTEDNSKQNLK
jgi:hypothetical protein